MLAFGTKVKVTNTLNNKSVEKCRSMTADRPCSAGAIDLSTAAAAKLGMKKNGTAPVKLEVVGEAPQKK